jgi:hypothetical protein
MKPKKYVLERCNRPDQDSARVRKCLPFADPLCLVATIEDLLPSGPVLQ